MKSDEEEKSVLMVRDAPTRQNAGTKASVLAEKRRPAKNKFFQVVSRRASERERAGENVANAPWWLVQDRNYSRWTMRGLNRHCSKLAVAGQALIDSLTRCQGIKYNRALTAIAETLDENQQQNQ